MQTNTLPTAKQLKQRCQLVLSVQSAFVIGIIVGFFYPLLSLSAAQYRILLYAFFPLAGLSWIASEAFYAVALKPINAYLTAYAQHRHSAEQRARAFARAARFPQLCITFSFSTYFLGGLGAGLALHLNSETFTLYHFCVVVSAVTLGGLVGQILNFILTKDVIQPLRLHLASQFQNLEERERLVQSIPLATKLVVSLAGLVLSTVLFCVFLAQKRAADTIENFQVAQQSRLLDELQNQIAKVAAQSPTATDAELRNSALAALETELRVLDLKIRFLTLTAEYDLQQFASEAELSEEETQYIVSRALASASDAAGDPALRRGDSLALDTSSTYAWLALPSAAGSVEPQNTTTTLTLITPASAQVDHRFSVLGTTFVWMVLVSGAIALFVAFRVGSDFSRGADAVRAQLQRISAGDLTRGNCFESEDEFGSIARAVERTTVSLHATITQVDAAASELETATEALVSASDNVANASQVQTLEIQQAAYAMDSINSQIQDIAGASEELNRSVDESSAAIAQLSGSGEAVHETSIEVNHRIAEIGSSLQQMLFNIQQITENSTALAEIAAQSASSIEETAASVREVEKNAQQTAALSDGVIRNAEEGHLRVRQTISGMEAIRSATTEAQEVTNRLGKRVQEIGDVVSVINSVADETSLLALNAAIIAAQAGEQGRAFSVVANEIKDLAARVLASTQKIDEQIRSVQVESASAVHVIERGFDSVQSGVELSNQAGVALDAITRSARESGGHIQQIVAAVHEHAAVAEHMMKLIENIGHEVGRIQHSGQEHTQGARVVHQNALTIEEATSQLQSATREQARTAHSINDHVGRIRESTGHIRTSLKQQSTGCQAVAESLESLSQRTRGNETSALQMQQATKILLTQRESLRKSIQNFKISEEPK